MRLRPNLFTLIILLLLAACGSAGANPAGKASRL